VATQTETVELLRRVPLFNELSTEELEQVAQVAVPRAYPAGVRVFHEGDPGDACYIVRTGGCRVTRQHSDGRALILASFGPGDFFGELAMFDGESRSASIETSEETELLAITGGQMRAILAKHPEITVKLVIALTRRLRAANERIARQSFQTVPSRVAGILSQLASDTDSESGEPILIKMTQADLAQLAGASRESVSRFLSTLESAGVVATGRGRLQILDPGRLENYVF
jgi:CRP/FNR family transcriptional regulator, cyclic AMP receptor protein